MAVKQQPATLWMIFDLSHLSALWNGHGGGGSAQDRWARASGVEGLVIG